MNDSPNSTNEPSDSELEAEIINFDPLTLPSAVKVKGHPKIGEPKITMFPQEVQNRINAELATVTPGNRDLFAREMVMKELKSRALAARVIMGPGEGATEYAKEQASIANDLRLLGKDAARIEAQLAEQKTAEGPDGNPVALPIPVVQGDQRRLLDGQLAEVRRQARLLEGHEGEKRTADALQRSKDHIRNTRQQLAEDAEARRLGEEQLRTERVQKRAEQYAKSRRSNIG